MSGAVRIGVAGAGLIGRKHIELIAASPDCVLAGIADPSPEAKELAESRGDSLVRRSSRFAGAGDA